MPWSDHSTPLSDPEHVFWFSLNKLTRLLLAEYEFHQTVDPPEARVLIETLEARKVLYKVIQESVETIKQHLEKGLPIKLEDRTTWNNVKFHQYYGIGPKLQSEKMVVIQERRAKRTVFVMELVLDMLKFNRYKTKR